MSKKDLIRLLIKIAGIILFFNYLSSFISQVALFIITFEWSSFLLLLVSTLITISLVVILIFYPDKVINLLRLDKGFDDERVTFNFQHAEAVVGIIILALGGIFILNNIAPLMVEIGYRIQTSVDSNQFLSSMPTPNDKRLYISIIEIGIGYLLMSNYKLLAQILTSKKRD